MSHDDIELSVLVTVYNRERYLADALRSILSSRYQDFEVIVTDDRSSDGSLAIAEKFASEDARIRVYSNDVNLGQFANRNQAAQHARGRFIKFLDSDDLAYPHTFDVMLHAIRSGATIAQALCSPVIDPDTPYPILLSPQQAFEQEFLGRGCLSTGPSGAIIRHENFQQVGGFRELGVVSDIDLWYRLAATGDTVLMPPSLVFWRRHPDQAFSNEKAELDYLENGFRIAMDALENQDCPLSGKARQTAIDRVRQHHARRLLRLGFIGRSPKLAYQLAQRSGLGCMTLLRGFRGYT